MMTSYCYLQTLQQYLVLMSDGAAACSILFGLNLLLLELQHLQQHLQQQQQQKMLSVRC